MPREQRGKSSAFIIKPTFMSSGGNIALFKRSCKNNEGSRVKKFNQLIKDVKSPCQAMFETPLCFHRLPAELLRSPRGKLSQKSVYIQLRLLF
jgi:hypothetical protein